MYKFPSCFNLLRKALLKLTCFSMQCSIVPLLVRTQATYFLKIMIKLELFSKISKHKNIYLKVLIYGINFIMVYYIPREMYVINHNRNINVLYNK